MIEYVKSLGLRILEPCCLLCDQPLNVLYHKTNEEPKVSCKAIDNVCSYCLQALPRYSVEHSNLLSLPKIKQCLPASKFDNLLAVSPYQWPFSQLIPQFKYRQSVAARRTLVNLLVEQIKQVHAHSEQPLPDALIAVPMHTIKLLTRGDNHSAQLASYLAADLSIPDWSYVLKQRHWRRAQASKNRIDRQKISFHDYRLNPATQFDGINHIAIVDDVVTTGSTANAIAALLKHNGVSQVSLWTLCIAENE